MPKKTKRVRTRIGEFLPLLPNYPASIADNMVYDLFGFHDKRAETFEDNEFPELRELRKRIRETGRDLAFPKLKKTVLGVNNGQVVFA